MAQPEQKSRVPVPVNDRLNGWKEIGSHMGKSARTAQRWERLLGLPVHRLGALGGRIIFAFRSEIDHWQLTSENPGPPLPPKPDSLK